MVVILEPFSDEKVKKEIESLALRVFIKSLELIGGPKELIEFRNLTWLPSLMRASFAVVMKDHGYTIDQIAKYLGISESTVKQILSADEEKVLEKIEMKKKEVLEEESEDEKVHIAGGLAKLAYKKIKESEDNTTLQISVGQEICKALDIPWAVEVLEAIKGTKFPVDKETLKEKLKGLTIKGHPAEEILEKIEYPIKNPAELLHKIKEVLEKLEQ
jgi:probable regulatory domain-containing protein